jgi:hypothetical protein
MNEKLNIMQKEVTFEKNNHFYSDKSNPRL